MFHARGHRFLPPGLALFVLLASVSTAAAQVKAVARTGATPPWNTGIQPISSASYYHAIDCGKQGGSDPACVFWDTGLCKNSDFTLSMYTPYKMVAYEVWRVVQQKQPPPQPNYAEAQRTRITIGVTPVRGSTNLLTDLVLKRGGKVVEPTARSVAAGRFTYDFPAFAPTATVSLDLVGKSGTVSCTIDRTVLATFR